MTLLPGVVVYTLILAPWRLRVGRIELHRESEVRRLRKILSQKKKKHTLHKL